MSDPKSLQEAPASVTASVKSPNGTPVLWTLRAETGSELLEKFNNWEKLALGLGWTAQEKYAGKSNGASAVTKPCPIHQGAVMYQKDGKFGPFFSHKLEGQFQVDGRQKYCNGENPKMADATDHF